MNPDNFIKLHTQLKARCEMNHAQFFEINDNYEEEMSKVYQCIDEQLLDKGGFKKFRWVK